MVKCLPTKLSDKQTQLLVKTVVKAEQAYLEKYGSYPSLIILSSQDFNLEAFSWVCGYTVGKNLITSDLCPSGQCIVGEMIYNIKGDLK
jgi:hypothetical protein